MALLERLYYRQLEKVDHHEERLGATQFVSSSQKRTAELHRGDSAGHRLSGRSATSSYISKRGRSRKIQQVMSSPPWKVTTFNGPCARGSKLRHLTLTVLSTSQYCQCRADFKCPFVHLIEHDRAPTPTRAPQGDNVKDTSAIAKQTKKQEDTLCSNFQVSKESLRNKGKPWAPTGNKEQTRKFNVRLRHEGRLLPRSEPFL